jgi:hypothetical protein
MPNAKRTDKVRTTVRLPRTLYEQARKFVQQDVSPVDTINEFFVAAISAYVKLQKRKQVDAAFACMAENTDYQKEAKLMAEEFSQSDWEAFEQGEVDHAGVES